MDNVIYQVHLYKPEQYTHQGVRGSATGFRWPDPARGWDKDYLRRQLEPVRAFQLRHGARIYVGEFSAIAWAEGAENYLRDCIDLFGEYGWDWTYHAFREWDGWSVEHEGPDAAHLVPSDDNPRKRVLLEGFGDGPLSNAPTAAAKPVDWDSAWLSGSLGRECLFAVRVPCAGGRPVTGWLTMPADASPERRYPVFVGFRGATTDDQPALGGGPHGSIQFVSSGHGFDLGRGPDYVKAFFAPTSTPSSPQGASAAPWKSGAPDWGTTSRRRPRLRFSTTPWTSRRRLPGTRAGRTAGVQAA